MTRIDPHLRKPRTTAAGRCTPEQIWRMALGPGYAVGPSSRLIDELGRTATR